MSGNILDNFDELTQNYDFDKGKSQNVVGNLFTLLGGTNKFIAGTYKSLINRPELFGENSINFLYCLDVGQTFKKEALYLMFQGFLKKPPQTTESNIIFLWAEYLRKYNSFIKFEPIFAKLNRIIQTWFDEKSVNYKGKSIPLAMFKPLLYNSYGVNIIELLPYICYIYTYHISGYAFKFNDAMSSSSLKSYISSIEDWFAKCYTELYKEAQIPLTENTYDEKDIDDEVWKSFYKTMLSESKIVEIRNEEIRKTDNLFTNMISDQEYMNDDDLRKLFGNIMGDLVEICIKNSPFNIIAKKIPVFDNKYYDVVDLSNLTSYFVTDCKNSIMIDSDNYYKYNLCDTELEKIVETNYENFKFNKLDICIHKPFCSSDVVLEMFKGYIQSKFEAKRSSILDNFPIWINVSDLDNENIYPFILDIFVNGIWNYEYEEMKMIMDYFKNNEYINDLFALRNTLQIIYGNTTSSILTPIYIISYLNSWIYEFCNMNQDINNFNPFIFMNSMVVDESRITKLKNMLYSVIFMNNEEYIKFVNNHLTKFYEIMRSNPIILQPYIQAFDDDTKIFALGGCDCYQYAKISNPLIRGYGFISCNMEVNEHLYVIYKYTSQITNNTIFELIKDNENDEKTILNTIALAIKNNNINIHHLYRFKFEINDKLTYSERVNTAFVDLQKDGEGDGGMEGGRQGRYLISDILRYSFKQTETSEILPYEQVVVKRYEFVDGKLNASIISTVNGYRFNDSFINLSLMANGSTKRIPVYNYASKFMDRNLIVINPEGRKLIEIITPSSYNYRNNLFWIFTNLKGISIFNENDGVKLIESGFHPKSGTFMLTDRIQPIPKM